MKRILIVIDGSENDADSLTSARACANMTAAQLTVAHARIPHHSIVGVGEFLYAGDDSKGSEQNEARAKSAFDEVCGDLADKRLLIYDAGGEEIIAATGHGYDLIIVERLSREDGPEASNLNAALFDTGRPVLLIPPVATSKGMEHVAIAWNGTAQTARAVKSALPLLRPEQTITVLQGSGGEAPTDFLLEYLGAYGLSPQVQSYDSERLTARARGRALIAASVETDADLLVTGAFGESRPGVLSGLGRATRKVVTAAPMPVLMQS